MIHIGSRHFNLAFDLLPRELYQFLCKLRFIKRILVAVQKNDFKKVYMFSLSSYFDKRLLVACCVQESITQ